MDTLLGEGREERAGRGMALNDLQRKTHPARVLVSNFSEWTRARVKNLGGAKQRSLDYSTIDFSSEALLSDATLSSLLSVDSLESLRCSGVD